MFISFVLFLFLCVVLKKNSLPSDWAGPALGQATAQRPRRRLRLREESAARTPPEHAAVFGPASSRPLLHATSSPRPLKGEIRRPGPVFPSLSTAALAGICRHRRDPLTAAAPFRRRRRAPPPPSTSAPRAAPPRPRGHAGGPPEQPPR